MKKSDERGEIMQAWVLLIALLIIIFVFVVPSHKVGPLQSFPSPANTSNTSSHSSYSGGSNDPKKTSIYSGGISIGTGNAAYAYQPYEEYITIQNYGQVAVDITGWKLQNAKDKRVYRVGSSEQMFSADVAIIPQAIRTLTPQGGPLEDVILKPNETAIINTGSIPSTYPYKITSFKENECTGYLGNLQYYSFSPYLSSSCVNPADEPGLQSQDRECVDFVGRMSMCHTPEYQTVDSKGQICNGCVDQNSSLSNSCVAFIKSHFSYEGCVATHASDSNFEGKQWRIFLGRPWEMWAKDHETISLYDRQGNLVDYQSY